MDQTLAPEGQEGLYVLVPVPELSMYEDWSDEIVQEYRQKVLTLIKEKTLFKDIEAHIVSGNIYDTKKILKNSSMHTMVQLLIEADIETKQLLPSA